MSSCRSSHRRRVRAGDGLRGLPGHPDARGLRPRRAARRGRRHRLPAQCPGGHRRGDHHDRGLRRLHRSATTRSSRSIGFALAIGVLFDAFVVRMTIVPAVMSLLGDAAWWLPALARPGAAQRRHRGREADGSSRPQSRAPASRRSASRRSASRRSDGLTRFAQRPRATLTQPRCLPTAPPEVCVTVDRPAPAARERRSCRSGARGCGTRRPSSCPPRGPPGSRTSTA